MAKLERLAALIPDSDNKKSKAQSDLLSMSQSLEKIMMDDTNTDEMQAKKLMTVAKSKYYMLKVNYPALAETIDNTPEP